MNNFDPGPGWREVTYEEWRGDDVPDGSDTAYIRAGRTERYFFRENPVPPLPTEPYTVIRVVWVDSMLAGQVLTLGDDGRWNLLTPAEVREQILRFEVLSEPRGVTAKKISDLLEEGGYDVSAETVRRVYEVRP